MSNVFDTGGNRMFGCFHVDTALMSYSPTDKRDPPLDEQGNRIIARNSQVNYSQTVTRLYEIDTPNTFLIAGPVSGNANIPNTVGRQSVQVEFNQRFGVALVQGNDLNFQAVFSTCNYRLESAVLTQVSATFPVNDLLCTEGVQIGFSKLAID